MAQRKRESALTKYVRENVEVNAFLSGTLEQRLLPESRDYTIPQLRRMIRELKASTRVDRRTKVLWRGASMAVPTLLDKHSKNKIFVSTTIDYETGRFFQKRSRGYLHKLLLDAGTPYIDVRGSVDVTKLKSYDQKLGDTIEFEKEYILPPGLTWKKVKTVGPKNDCIIWRLSKGSH